MLEKHISSVHSNFFHALPNAGGVWDPSFSYDRMCCPPAFCLCFAELLLQLPAHCHTLVPPRMAAPLSARLLCAASAPLAGPCSCTQHAPRRGLCVLGVSAVPTHHRRTAPQPRWSGLPYSHKFYMRFHIGNLQKRATGCLRRLGSSLGPTDIPSDLGNSAKCWDKKLISVRQSMYELRFATVI